MSQPSDVHPPATTVAVVAAVDDELVDAFARLIPQLSSSSPPPGRSELQALVDRDDTVLFVARVDAAIVGSLTLAFYRIPTGLKAWIEDVVVDDAARGKGVGEALNLDAIDRARGAGGEQQQSESEAQHGDRDVGRGRAEPLTDEERDHPGRDRRWADDPDGQSEQGTAARDGEHGSNAHWCRRAHMHACPYAR